MRISTIGIIYRICIVLVVISLSRIRKCFPCRLLLPSVNFVFVSFVEDRATVRSIRYFGNHVSKFVQNQRGSVIKSLARNPGILGSSHTGSSGVFVGVFSGKTLQSPGLVLVKPRKKVNNVSCSRYITEIMLKAVTTLEIYTQRQ